MVEAAVSVWSWRLDSNRALRENRPGALTEDRAILKEWTPDVRDALAGLSHTQWEVVSLSVELIQRELTENFFPQLPGDGTVGREAAIGALNCSMLCSQLLFALG